MYVYMYCTVCGKSRKSYAERATLRIVGGILSKPGDWPFLAAILGGPEEVFYCAGVLISDQWVLTASHCVGKYVITYIALLCIRTHYTCSDDIFITYFVIYIFVLDLVILTFLVGQSNWVSQDATLMLITGRK